MEQNSEETGRPQDTPPARAAGGVKWETGLEKSSGDNSRVQIEEAQLLGKRAGHQLLDLNKLTTKAELQERERQKAIRIAAQIKNLSNTLNRTIENVDTFMKLEEPEDFQKSGPFQMTRSQKRKAKRKKAMQVHEKEVSTYKQALLRKEALKEDLALMTSQVYQEVGLDWNNLANTRNERWRERYERELQVEADGVRQLFKETGEDTLALNKEKERLQRIIQDYAQRGSWKQIEGSQVLLQELKKINATKGFKFTNPMSIFVELKLMMEKSAEMQAKMFRYEDYLAAEYRLIRYRLKAIEVRMKTAIKVRMDMTREIKTMRGLVAKNVNIFEKFIEAVDRAGFQDVTQLEVDITKEMYKDNIGENTFQAVQDEKRKALLEGFLQDIDHKEMKAELGKAQKNQEEALQKLYSKWALKMSLNSGNTEEILKAFEEFVKKEELKVNEEMKKASKEVFDENSRRPEIISDFMKESFDKPLDYMEEDEDIEENIRKKVRIEEEPSEINQERRQKNRECWKFLQDKVLNFGTGYLVTPRNIDAPEEVWLDLEDPFGVNNDEFLLNGEYEDMLSNIFSEVVSWEIFEQRVLQGHKEVEENLNTQNNLL